MNKREALKLNINQKEMKLNSNHSLIIIQIHLVSVFADSDAIRV